MNTLTSISVEAPRKTAEKALDGSFALLRELNGRLSRYAEASDISKVNASAGIAPVKVAPETWELLRNALTLSEATDGYFDPTIGPLTDLWRILSKEGNGSLSEKEIAAARDLVDYRSLSLVSPDWVFLRSRGAALDLGAVAKGYAADRVADYCKALGVRSGLLDLGGNILVWGSRKRPWRIGIRHPLEGRDSTACVLEFDLAPDQTMSVVTSGSYERFREVGGKKLSHIFNPHTGVPIETSLLSVSVVDPCSAKADALATAFLVMGEEKARETLRRFPGTEAVFIHHNGEKIVVSKNQEVTNP
ncbi:MAG: FAD:protein FMN transferase [Synergistaceae bacterium]|nr:FAD:protein FMN transferase [Synergistaceae bacterium]